MTCRSSTTRSTRVLLTDTSHNDTQRRIARLAAAIPSHPIGLSNRAARSLLETRNQLLIYRLITVSNRGPTLVIKLLWLALRNVLTKSVRTTYDWKSAMNQFAILYGERFTAARG
ncbi:hypothetical protein KAF44_23245 (plasmid) [Cupriavidus necator]|nr:hypothetical protein KAF44_23245 [Cupriavidus necator]